jgi:hypothetical protein
MWFDKATNLISFPTTALVCASSRVTTLISDVSSTKSAMVDREELLVAVTNFCTGLFVCEPWTCNK